MHILNTNSTHPFLLVLGQNWRRYLKKYSKLLKIHQNIDYENIYDEGQGQGWQNWLRAGLDQPVDSLRFTGPDPG